MADASTESNVVVIEDDDTNVIEDNDNEEDIQMDDNANSNPGKKFVQKQRPRRKWNNRNNYNDRFNNGRFNNDYYNNGGYNNGGYNNDGYHDGYNDGYYDEGYNDRYNNDRYNNAYGDYAGGYGPPGGGFGRNFAPPRNYGPPPMMFPPGPQGPQGPPPFMWGRGFGPEGPPIRKQQQEDKTIKYLIRCGVGKEHLKNLPRDLLQLIEPEYCGLCAHSFDSFATSRLHYISKNHLKNHKKWLNQQSETGFRRNKEATKIALKARELYCELCDVHITSKSHSDSHYAGKPHRAIVEGRKNPKNPFLLQRGMEDRVAQLIRREKKHLKPEDEEEDTEKAKDNKNVPELYCDICKTSVTCTEQMTMHLNGKRHLSKEKQHILKMMKGNPDENTGETQEEPGDEMDEDNENENEEDDVKEKEGEKGDAAEDYDWGNGSGTWDEVKNDDAY